MAFIEGIHIGNSSPLLIFRGRWEMLVAEDWTLPTGAQAGQWETAEGRFTDSASGAAAGSVPEDAQAPEGWRFVAIREFFAVAPEADALLAARMRGYSTWLSATLFCPACGARLEYHTKENAKVCPSCGKVHYPRIEPCVIAVIEKGDEMLLLRHSQRNQNIYACMAGFVETGESLEQALKREALEETGIVIDNIRYAGSQSWPFPDQLMVAFYADYVSGELKIQEDEISEAKWFRKDDIPASPRPGSISWRLIHYDFKDK